MRKMGLVLVLVFGGLFAFGLKRAASIPDGGRKEKPMDVVVRDLTDSGELTAPKVEPVPTKDDSDWRKALRPDRYRVLREAETERPFSGELLAEHRDGWYVCHACGLPLFRSDAKFESHCGWPSFHTPSAYENIRMVRDSTHGMNRTEILCARCGGHLGHVFDDGPTPTGLRYCVNSLSLDFKAVSPPRPGHLDTAIFAAGCFWGVEKLFYETPGVVGTSVGYTGGISADPTYKQVCTGRTGHAEAVEVAFDPAKVSYRALVRLFFLAHDPTTQDRQGPDHGSQYRSAIFCRSRDQEATAREVLAELSAKGTWKDPVVTEIVSSSVFWKAEGYHQKWFLTHPVQCHRPPS